MSQRTIRIVGLVALVAVTNLGASHAIAQQTHPAGEVQKAPTLRVLEAENNVIALRLERPPDDGIAFHVEETAGVDVPSLKVDVVVRGPDGSPAQIDSCTIAGKPCATGAPVPAVGSVEVRLKADWSKMGVYDGSLVLISDKRNDVTRITLTRTFAKDPIELSVPTEVVGRGGQIKVPISLREISGATWMNVQPTLRILRCKDADNPKLGELTPAVEPAMEALGAYATAHATLSGSHLAASGECEAEVIVVADGAEPLHKAVKLMLRRPFWLGIGLIALSILMSSLLRYFVVVRQPAKQQQMRVLLALRKLDAFKKQAEPLDPDESQLVDRVFQACLKSDERLRMSLDMPKEEEMTRLVNRVELVQKWTFVHRRRNKTLSTLSDAQRKVVDQALSQAADVVRGDDAANADFATLKARLDEALETMTQAVDGQFDALRADVLGQDTTLDEAMQPILSKIDEAKAIQKDNPARAVELFDQARLLYAQALSHALVETVQGPAPSWFSIEQIKLGVWDKLGADVASWVKGIDQETSADKAASQYQSAYRRYLRRLLEALKTRAKTLAEMVNYRLTKQPSEGEKQALERFLDDLTAALRNAELQLKGADLSKAKQAYELAVDAAEAIAGTMDEGEKQSYGFRTLLSAVSAGLAPAGGPLVGSVAALVSDVFEPSADGTASGDRWQAKITRLKRATGSAELGIGAATFGIAVLVGMKALDLQSATWGTYTDMINAVLWGFGLHQVGGAAFTGLAVLRDKIRA